VAVRIFVRMERSGLTNRVTTSSTRTGDDKMEKLIKETSWSRVYERDDGSRSVRSKFTTDGLSIEPDELKRMWSQWDARTRLDFAQAFSAKASFSKEDCNIVEFLAAHGSDVVASAVAVQFASCSGSKVFDMLAARIRNARDIPRSNFFRALGQLGDPRGVTVLDECRETLHNEIGASQASLDGIIDYLSCCAALALLTKDPSYSREVEAYLKHERDVIRFAARAIIDTSMKGL
jgi:hypothetical protein